MANSVVSTAMQITNTGGLDNYLTGEPETSLFSYGYKQVTTYAKHTTMIPFNEKVSFGKTLTATIPVFGDLLHSMYLYFQLPPLTLPQQSTFVGYTQSIGYAMIDYIEVRIGEVLIDRQSGLFLEILDYLTTSANQTEAHYKSIGRYDTVNVLPINAIAPQHIYIPLQFWFNKKLSSALPLVTLAGQQVKIILKLKAFIDVITFDGPIEPVEIPIAQSGLIIDYYILNEKERSEFQSYPQEYLIEQWQETEIGIPPGLSTSRFNMDFTKCIKELIFVVREAESEKNNDFFNFGRRDQAFQGGEFLETVSLLFDGKVRLEKLPESYYRLIISQKYHSFAGVRNIYVLPFAALPEINQPSGTANFSRYDNVELAFDFIDNVPECSLFILGINYNRLVIEPNGEIQIEFLT